MALAERCHNMGGKGGKKQNEGKDKKKKKRDRGRRAVEEGKGEGGRIYRALNEKKSIDNFISA